MGILFPIVIYEGRMSLLINTYLKTLRKEKTILFVNIITLGVTLLASLFVIFIVGNLDLTVLLILISLALRCNLAEFFLYKDLRLTIGWKHVIETLLTVLFILSNVLFNASFASMVVYVVIYIVYLAFIHRSIIASYKDFRILLKER